MDMKNTYNKKINSRFIIGENDEGPHENKIYETREWWYFNTFFNHQESDLKNWSILLIIRSFLKTDVLKILLQDNKNNSYESTWIKEGGIKASGLNINVDKSFIRGLYPKWNLHFDNAGEGNKEIVADLEYKATKQPIWIFKNTGHNMSTSMLGYYFIMNCDVKGTITIDNTKYNVRGVGYHDHFWSPLYKKNNKQPDETKKGVKKKELVWDWIYIHLNNEWNLFIGKIYFSKRNLISVFMPGSLNFVSDENNMMESYFFPIIYKNFQNTSIPNLKVPNEVKIKSIKINPLNKYPIRGPLYLDLNYKTENIKEAVSGDPPHRGIWDSSGKVTGKLKGFRKEIELEGFGIMEYTDNL